MSVSIPIKQAKFLEADAASIAAACAQEAGTIGLNSDDGSVVISANAGGSPAAVQVGGQVSASSSTRNAGVLCQTLTAYCSNASGAQAGFGPYQQFNASTDDNSLQRAARIEALWTDPAHATVSSKLVLQVRQSGADLDGLALVPTTTDDESIGVLLMRQGGAWVAKVVKQGADGTGPGGANRALYVVT